MKTNYVSKLAVAALCLLAVSSALANTHHMNHKGAARVIGRERRVQQGWGILYVFNTSGETETLFVNGSPIATLQNGAGAEWLAFSGNYNLQVQTVATGEMGPVESDVVVAGRFTDVDIIP